MDSNASSKESLIVKTLSEALVEGEVLPQGAWQVRMFVSADCLSYVVWNEEVREVLVVDPKEGEMEIYRSLKEQLKGYLCLGVVDTHTHADHISSAAQIAHLMDAPLFMHRDAPSSRVHLRVSNSTSIASRAAKLQFIPTPGHTPDGICVVWGPFVFTGDTVLFGDVGRDDLPGGDPIKHCDSLDLLKNFLREDMLVLPGHDFKGGRVSSWNVQLRTNSSLYQKREEFIQEALAFEGTPPKLLKKSLFENFK